jgi:alkaline phosphatase
MAKKRQQHHANTWNAQCTSKVETTIGDGTGSSHVKMKFDMNQKSQPFDSGETEGSPVSLPHSPMGLTNSVTLWAFGWLDSTSLNG